MHAMPNSLDQSALRRVQLHVRALLRTVGGNNEARQSQGSSHAVSHSPVQGQSTKVRHRWFAERDHLGTRLSQSEIEHGVRCGIIGSALLIGDGSE